MPVQIYGMDGRTHGGISAIGRPVVEKIRRLGVKVTPAAMDFLSIALSVAAADTFVKREDAADGWTRELSIQLSLSEPEPWMRNKEKLEKALRFLSGDIWEFELSDDGFPPPTPYRQRDRFRLIELRDRDCICLFSGGLDSTIGAIDLLAGERRPLLVSHAYKGDKSRQDAVAERLQGRFSRFAANAYPVSANGKTDISMRTRSMGFLAFGAIGACATQSMNQYARVELFVPENGFISLNAPLTARRIGSLSTRTTHPHFIGMVQEIFDDVDIPCDVVNPYQFQTKGGMVLSCKNQSILRAVFDHTVSCSRWKRRNEQCGCCIPCLVRRAALHKAELREQNAYTYEHLQDVFSEVDRRDDLLAMAIAIQNLNTRAVGPWILESGPLSPEYHKAHQSVFVAGLKEVKAFLEKEGVL
jgi:hypothetical protein